MAGLGDLLGGILGGSAGKGDIAKATGLSREAMEQLKNLYVPTVSEQRVALTNPELAGLLEAAQVDGSALEGVSTDPRLKNAQMRALEELSGLSQQGLGAEDRAAYNQLQRQSAAQAQAENAQVLQNAAARGTLDSGSTLMAQLLAGQSAANRTQQGGEQLAAQASQARRQALGQYADLSSNLANTDFAQKAQVGSAKDTINQFNAQNRMGAGQFNLNNQQNIANQKASNANQQEIYNKQLLQQKFQNDLSKATGVAGQQNNLANMYAQQGANAAQGQSQMTGSLIGLAGTIGGAMVGGPAGAAAGGQIAKSGYGGDTAANASDDFYMNKVK